jgi:hypothetical protein
MTTPQTPQLPPLPEPDLHIDADLDADQPYPAYSVGAVQLHDEAMRAALEAQNAEPVSECDSPPLCRALGHCAGQYGDKKVCATQPQAQKAAAPANGYQAAMDIRTAQGWQLTGAAIPVLYTDTINGHQVMRDDVWLCTTEALANPAAAPELVGLTDEQVWRNDDIMSRNAVGGLPMPDLMRLVRAVEAAHGILPTGTASDGGEG